MASNKCLLNETMKTEGKLRSHMGTNYWVPCAKKEIHKKAMTSRVSFLLYFNFFPDNR